MVVAQFWSQSYYSFKKHKPIVCIYLRNEIIGEGTKVKVEHKIDPSIYVGSFNKRCLTCQVSTRAQQMDRLLREHVDLNNFESQGLKAKR
ncbi:unnamed protein product [Brassica oleracea var. botrytis]